MNRRTFGSALMAATVFSVAPSAIFAQSKHKNATIVLPISIAAGKTRDDRKEIYEALKTFVAEIGKHPGLIDQNMMAGKYERPNFVHVSTWKSQTDWESLFGNTDFIKMLERISDTVSLQTADVYRPMDFN